MRRRPGAAFSLVEILVVMAILGVFLGLSLSLSSSRQKKQFSAQSMALELSGQLRWARERSRARGIPVALVFPRQPQPLCQSALILEGLVHGRVVRRLDYSSDSAYIYLGSDSSSSVPFRFSPTEWLPEPLRDQSVIAFLPSGQSWFQHLDHHQGVTRWAVGQGLGSSAQTMATVRLSQQGWVNHVKGLEGWNGPSPGALTVASVLPAIAAAPALAPEIVELKAQPAETAGVPIVTEPDTSVPIRIKVRDLDSNRVSCRWTCTMGSLSHSGYVPLEWDSESKSWLGEVSWTSSLGQPEGASVSIQCEVVDDQGHRVSNQTGTNLTFATGNSERILSYAIYLGAGGELFGGFVSMRPDGSAFRFDQRPEHDARLLGLSRSGLVAQIFKVGGTDYDRLQDRRGNPLPGTRLPRPPGTEYNYPKVWGLNPWHFEEYGLQWSFLGNAWQSKTEIRAHDKTLFGWNLTREWQSINYPLDGKSVVYCQGKYDGDNFGLYRLPTDGLSTPAQVAEVSVVPTGSFERATCWSGPGGEIFMSWREWEADHRYFGKDRWWRVDALGQTRDLGIRMTDSNVADRTLAFSPDGQSFASPSGYYDPVKKNYPVRIYSGEDLSQPRELFAPAGVYLNAGVNSYSLAIWRK